jgi:predicted nucleic acid-binding protein
MINKFSVDTNILVYLVQPDQIEKQKKAEEVYRFLAGQKTLISLQVLNEFYYVTTRKSILSPDLARTLIQEWMHLFEIITPNEETLLRGIDLQADYGLSFWDGLLIAVAQQHGVRYFFSEDGHNHAKIGGVQIENPFLVDNLAAIY